MQTEIQTLRKSAILFLIIFLEGYAVLSTELLAIRQLIPFVGSGTDTVSVVIAAVLMPLAFGYYAGGRFRSGYNDSGRFIDVRRKLIRNLSVAAFILSLCLSYFFLDWFFKNPFVNFGLNSRVGLTALYSGLFIAPSVFLLGQTVPLVSNYFSGEQLALTTGRILFFSTLGSFMGAVFCTLVLMTYAGVHVAVSVTIGCLALIVVLLSAKPFLRESGPALVFLAISLFLNSSSVLNAYGIVADNQYHLVQVKEDLRSRSFLTDHNLSSILYLDDKSHNDYIHFIDRVFIQSFSRYNDRPMKILVIGAAGFTLGDKDTKNSYLFLDLDPTLPAVAEKYFLKKPLSANKIYKPVEARAYLSHADQRFDLVVLDAFRGPSYVPEHLVTKEFYQQIRAVLNPAGVFAANYVVSPDFADNFSVKLDNTLRAVFGNINRQVFNCDDDWMLGVLHTNVVYSYYNNPEASKDIYTDDRNTSLFDKPAVLP